MAKNKFDDDLGQDASDPEPAAAPKAPAAKPDREIRKYRVNLAATTPLAVNNIEIEAHNAEEAKAIFFEKNGISGSDHALSIDEVLD